MDMDTPITRAEHEEFCKRMEAEDSRLNARLKSVENDLKDIKALTASVEKLAVNMENMMKIQEKQGSRLAELENRDGEMWRRVVGYVLTAVISVVVGFVFSQIGM